MKKFINLCVLILLGIISNSYAQYCTPPYSSGCSLDAIQYFSLKGEGGTVIYNNTGACVSSYNNYTSSFSPVTLSIGSSYSGFMRTQDPNNYVSIWIDQNDNNLFESGELILNNLKIGTSNLLYSIFIPTSFATGSHRMRVRNVYYGSSPVSPTDPCANYTYGETEDYQVMMTNVPGTRNVSSGIPGSCITSSSTTIDINSNNHNSSNIVLLDSSNNHLAGIYPQGNNLGTVSANVYVHNAAVRQALTGAYYLNRNIQLQSSIAPSSAFNARLFYKNTELNALIAQPGSGVTSQFDLSTTRNADQCQSALIDQSGTQFFPSGFGSLSGDRFLDFTGLLSMGNYYFSGSSLTSSCSVPLAPAVDLSTSTTGVFVWSAPSGGSPSGYEWAVTTSATAPTSGTFQVSTGVSFSGLTPNQVYYAHVRSVCGSSYSNWISLQFASILNDEPCDAILLTNGAAPLCYNTSSAFSFNDPSISCSAPNNTLWFKYTPTTSGPTTLRMTIPASGDPLNGWATWFTTAGTCPYLTFTQYPTGACQEFGQSGNGDVDSLISPVLTAGVTYYLMIDGFSGDVGEFCIQVINASPVPICTSLVSPTNGAVNVPNPGSVVSLSWNPAAGATSYDVYFGATDPPPYYFNTTSTNITFSGTTYNETYYWYVVPRNASGGATGCESTRFSFTTINPTNCIPLYIVGCGFGDSLTYFSLKGESGTVIYNQTGNMCSASPNLSYSNYTTSFTPVNLAIGESYSGFMRTGDPNNYATVWIDFNNNGYFEDTERLLNNLQIGTTKLLYSITIPLGVPLGNRRLRVRTMYYSATPSSPTHPCNLYYYGETEDYMVNIINSPGVKTVTPGLAGSCQLSSTTTIDAASNNINLNGIKMLDSMNRYVCSIYPNGNEFGRTSVQYYVHGGAVRLNPSGSYYLNRNLHMNVAHQPISPYNLRFFYRNTELNTLIAQSGSGVSSQFDLGLLQNPDACTSAMTSAMANRKSPTGFGSLGSERFLDFTGLNNALGFYLLKDCAADTDTLNMTVCGYGSVSATWNGTTYTNSGVYTVTFTNLSGCDSVVTLLLTLGIYPSLGNAAADPTISCAGSPVNLMYQSCAIQNGFSGNYDPLNWLLNYTGNSNGSITPFAPDSIIMVSSDGLSGDGATSWSITAPCSGLINFNWSYTTVDGPMYDFPRYSINGGIPDLLPGYSTGLLGPQSGTASIAVNAGDIFTFDIYSTDNIAGSCSVNISNFQGPTNGGAQVVNWYSDASLTSYIGTGANFSTTPTLAGNYTYYATVSDPVSGCVNPTAVATNPVTVDTGSCGTTLNLQLYLQGYYTGAGTMNPVLYNQGVSGDNSIVDQIEVQLRNEVTFSIEATAFTFLNINGLASCSFNLSSGVHSYYIVIKHRNSIETWSKLPVIFSSGSTLNYNFSLAASQAYGDNQAEVSPSVWACYSGDINQDENIDLGDMFLIETDISNYEFGYFSTDINGDGNVDLLDQAPVENNINNFIFSVHP